MVQSLPTSIKTDDVVGFLQKGEENYTAGWVEKVAKGIATVNYLTPEKQVEKTKVPVAELYKLENLAYQLTPGTEVVICGGEHAGKWGTIPHDYDPHSEWRGGKINVISPKGVNLYPTEERVQLLSFSPQKAPQQETQDVDEREFSCFRWINERRLRMVEVGYTSDELIKFEQLNSSLKGDETLEQMLTSWQELFGSSYLSDEAEEEKATEVETIVMGADLASTTQTEEEEEEEPFRYKSLEQEEACKAVISKATEILQEHTIDYFVIGQQVDYIRTEHIKDFNEFKKWLASPEWRTAHGNRFKSRMAQYCQKMYKNAVENGLTVDALKENLQCSPTTSRKLFGQTQYAKNGALDEVKSRIEKGEVLDDVAVQEIQGRYTPPKPVDPFKDTGTGCYTCRHYQLENEVRHCALYEQPIKSLEKAKSGVETPEGGKFKASVGCRNLAAGEIEVKTTTTQPEESVQANSKPAPTAYQEILLPVEVFSRLEIGARSAAMKLEDYATVVVDKALEAHKWEAECERLQHRIDTLTLELVAVQSQPGEESEDSWFKNVMKEREE
jgi:hypothetical protein